MLFCAVLWHAVALATPVLDPHAAAGWLHSAMHVQNVDHHHHDGVVHYDDSRGKVRHAHAEHDLNPAGLLLDGWAHATPARAVVELATLVSGYPSPDLEGLFRPPQLT